MGGGGIGGIGPWAQIAQMMQKGTGDLAMLGGTAASIASTLTADSPKERTATQLPTSNPLTQAATFELLTRLGVPIDTSVLLQASPIQQALNRRFVTPISRESRRRLLNSQRKAITALENARRRGDTRSTNTIVRELLGDQESQAMKRLAADAGFSGMPEMFDAELEFRAQLPAVQEAANRAAGDFTRLSQLSTQEQIGALEQLGKVSDVNALRSQERDRLLRDLELRRPELLAAANAGGFNPAGGLEQLERARQDVDLEALNRALGYATGETAIASARGQTARGLDPRLIALGLAPSNTAGPGSVIAQTVSQPANRLSNALSVGGQALSNWGLLEVLQASEGGPLGGGGGLSGLSSLFGGKGPAAGGGLNALSALGGPA